MRSFTLTVGFIQYAVKIAGCVNMKRKCLMKEESNVGTPLPPPGLKLHSNGEQLSSVAASQLVSGLPDSINPHSLNREAVSPGRIYYQGG